MILFKPISFFAVNGPCCRGIIIKKKESIKNWLAYLF